MSMHYYRKRQALKETKSTVIPKPIPPSKREITRMKVADLRILADSYGIPYNEETTGADLRATLLKELDQ